MCESIDKIGCAVQVRPGDEPFCDHEYKNSNFASCLKYPSMQKSAKTRWCGPKPSVDDDDADQSGGFTIGPIDPIDPVLTRPPTITILPTKPPVSACKAVGNKCITHEGKFGKCEKLSYHDATLTCVKVKAEGKW